jgi:Cu-processing system ATP-binding protein
MIFAQNITKTFGSLKALYDVSLTFSKGECIALLGPNGSGKTTLIKSILGMVVPDSGMLHFNRENIEGKWLYRDQIGYMPQIGRYPENMTIANVIDMMKDLRKRSNGDQDEELIQSFGLNNMMEKKMRTLSGGTTQKVSASLAFLFNPSVLILDEPTAGLDPLSSEILKQKILKEKRNGKLVIITSHVLSELDDLVTQVAYMQEGSLMFHKTLSALKEETGETKFSAAITTIMKNKSYE